MAGGYDEDDVESFTSEKSCITSSDFSHNGLIRITKDSNEYTYVQHRFYNSLNSLVPHCPLANVHRMIYSSQSQKVRCETYKQQLNALKEKHNGSANEVLAWYEGSVEEILQVVHNGFDVSEMGVDSGASGIGLHLTPEWLSINSLMSSPVDKNGFRHVLLCRVLLGAVEEVHRGAGQSKPSCVKYDSAVDSLKSPTKYVIWYPNVNQNILPCYVLTVKMDLCRREFQKETIRRPTSPWIPFKKLIKVLSVGFPPSTISQIKRVHCQFMERKMDRSQFIRTIRQVTGDRPLCQAIKLFQEKQRTMARQKSLDINALLQ